MTKPVEKLLSYICAKNPKEKRHYYPFQCREFLGRLVSILVKFSRVYDYELNTIVFGEEKHPTYQNHIIRYSRRNTNATRK